MTKSIQQDIASRIRRERAFQGLNQAELADRVGTTQQYISELERGERNPSVITVERVARALDVPLSALLPKE